MIRRSYGLVVQELGRAVDRVLIVARMAGLRNGHGRFRPSDIVDLFDELRVPGPGNVSAVLSTLKKRNLVVKTRAERGQWSLTPVGQKTALENIEELDLAKLESELAGSPGSFFGNVRHAVLDPVFAPPRWATPIARLLEEFPFETNVFMMTRFPKAEQESDPIRRALAVARLATADHGLDLHVASDRQLDDDVLGNVAAHMWACQYGVGLLEDRSGKGLNYNVMTELGAMLMTGRRCALLKDASAPSDLPSDIVGLIYKPVDLDNPSSVTSALHEWAAKDLGLETCPRC